MNALTPASADAGNRAAELIRWAVEWYRVNYENQEIALNRGFCWFIGNQFCLKCNRMFKP